jgi:NADP-dependent 3-hydroxy acid dehydrogenase YdfG
MGASAFNWPIAARAHVIQLSSTRALVTGSTSGLGQAMAAALTAVGARVAISGRDAGRAAAVAAELGPRAFGLALDVRNRCSSFPPRISRPSRTLELLKQHDADPRGA